MITVNLPDGKVAQFPDGTPPEKIKEALAKKFGNPMPANMAAAKAAAAGALKVSPEAADKQAAFDKANSAPLQDELKMGRFDALGRGALQGLTLGFGDEIVAGIRPFIHEGETYDSALGDQRQALDVARRDRPGYAYGGEIGGSVASGLSLGSLLKMNQATGTLARAGEGAKLGAIEGAIYGTGQGEGVEDRAKGAATFGALGGVIGGAAPIAIDAIKAGVDRGLVGPLQSAFTSSPSGTRASRAIQTALERSGKTADDVSDDLTRSASEGQPEFMLADALGNSGQRMLGGVSRSPGNARQAIAEALVKRQDSQGGRVGRFLAEALDAPDTAAARETALRASRKTAADAAYTAARGQAGPVNLTPAIETIDDLLNRNPILGESALGKTEIGQRLTDLRGKLTAGGEQLIDFDRVLNIKQDLYGAIKNLAKSGKSVPPQMQMVYDELDKALEGASSAYRTANDDFARASKVIEKINAGKAATSSRVRAEDTRKALVAMTPEERAAFKAGYADPTIARVDSAAPGVNKARALRSDKATAELGAMASDPRLLNDRLAREMTMFETANSALGGSRTADNLQDIADVSGFDVNALVNILTGNWKTAATQLGQKAVNASKGQNEGTRELIAKMLMGGDIRGALQPAMRADRLGAQRSRVYEALLKSSGRAGLINGLQ